MLSPPSLQAAWLAPWWNEVSTVAVVNQAEVLANYRKACPADEFFDLPAAFADNVLLIDGAVFSHECLDAVLQIPWDVKVEIWLYRTKGSAVYDAARLKRWSIPDSSFVKKTNVSWFSVETQKPTSWPKTLKW